MLDMKVLTSEGITVFYYLYIKEDGPNNLQQGERVEYIIEKNILEKMEEIDFVVEVIKIEEKVLACGGITLFYCLFTY